MITLRQTREQIREDEPNWRIYLMDFVDDFRRHKSDQSVAEPELLPPAWQQGGDGPRGQRTARRVCDYIAGMTDAFFRRTYEQWIGPAATLPTA